MAGYFLGRPIIYKFANSRWGHLCLLNQEKVEKSEKYFDYYLFFKADDEWHVILIGKDNLETFGLKAK